MEWIWSVEIYHFIIIFLIIYFNYVKLQARINKSKDKNVLQNLSLLAYSTIKKVGLFSSFKTESYSNFNLAKCDDLGGWKRDDGIVLQTGVVRVNCVDCLGKLFRT